MEKERLIQHPVLGCAQHPLFPQARISVPRKCNQHIKTTLANMFCQPIINVAFQQNSSSTQAWPNHGSRASQDQPSFPWWTCKVKSERGCIPGIKWLAPDLQKPLFVAAIIGGKFDKVETTELDWKRRAHFAVFLYVSITGAEVKYRWTSPVELSHSPLKEAA